MGELNIRLLPSKMFYFFFFSALGSIIPYISLFFKQLRLSSQQTGLLTGLRPLVQCIANPVWGVVVDKTNIRKISLLVGVIGWLLTYTCIGFIPSHGITSSCHTKSSEIANNSADMKESQLKDRLLITNISHWKSRRPWSESNETIGHQIPQDKIISDRKQLSAEISRQILNSDNVSSNGTVSTKDDINPAAKELFLILLLVIAFGNIFSAPAQTMANIATLQVLSEQSYKYGKQRLFGSVGWGLTSFVVGVVIGLTKTGSRECGENRAIDYRPCFYVFGVLMAFALIVATFLKLTKEEAEENRNVKILINIRKQIDFTAAYLLVMAVYCGFALGFVETFLFWHLHDLGGTQVLFSIIIGVNSLAEMIGFFFSEHFIERSGHLNVIGVGLFSSSVQMLCYGLAKSPWVVLPVEVLKSLVVSCTWAALVSYVGVHRGSVATLQTILHALYWGFGYASGGVIGGFFVHKFGAANVFLAMALCGSLNAFFLILVVKRKDACLKHSAGYQDLAEETHETDIEVE